MPASSLFVRMFFVYVLVSMTGIAAITLHNLYINGLPFSRFFGGPFFIKLAMGVGMIVGFQAYSLWRLGPAVRLAADGSAASRRRAWLRLTRFPTEMFLAMLSYGLLVSPAYHLIMSGIYDRGSGSWIVSPIVWENLLFDQTLSLCLAGILYFSLSRVCRAGAARLREVRIPLGVSASFVRQLGISFVALYLIVAFSVLWFTANSLSASGNVNLSALAAVCAVGLCAATAVFAIGALDQRDRFRGVTARIRELDRQHGKPLYETVSIVSADEAGQLEDAFNRLQQKRMETMEEAARELRLASEVQLRLLPKPGASFGALKAAAYFRPTREVGGDFYDFVRLDDRRTAIVIGDVSGKGVQAALLMSAAMVLVRSELRRSGRPEQVLAAVNRDLADLSDPYSYVTMGIAIIDEAQPAVDYAGAGHLPPYLLRGASLLALELPSLPLGIDPDAVYRSQRLPLAAGDRLVMITDGIVESRDQAGELYGFDRLERCLREIPPSLPPQHALDELSSRLMRQARPPYQDDRTIVLVGI
jgi:serine phosphatase RsbU (regulator of sigma subunit)